jgi:hypothetical protein
MVSMIPLDPDFNLRSSLANPTMNPSIPTQPPVDPAEPWTGAEVFATSRQQSPQPWSQPRRRRAGTHLSTGLRSPLSWLIYALLATFLVAWLHSFWRQALLAFACTALVGGLWILVGSRRRAPRDDEALLALIDAMAGLEFEAWIVARLASAGFAVRNVRDSGDFGVDIITWRHGLTLGLQPKRYEGKVGNDAVQQVLAGCDYHGCQLAVVLTQSRFTAAAREQAEKARHPVVLIERTQLLDLVDVLDVAAADPGIRRRILSRRSLAVYGLDRSAGLPDRLPAQPERPGLAVQEAGSGQEAAEDLVAQRYALGTEPQS